MYVVYIEDYRIGHIILTADPSGYLKDPRRSDCVWMIPSIIAEQGRAPPMDFELIDQILGEGNEYDSGSEIRQKLEAAGYVIVPKRTLPPSLESDADVISRLLNDCQNRA